jgi:homoserine O-acetyltransferase
MPILRRVLILAALALPLLLAPSARAAGPWPGQTEGDWVLRDYKFASGEVLPELTLHYTTLGTPRRDAAGRITNAVMLLHGSSGTGKNWLQPQFADAMFGPSQPLDLAQWYVVLPDGIGRGGSSKPSDGLRMSFPHYRYQDMVALQHALLTQHLDVAHLRLLLGGSMGGMHVWMWAGLYPDMMDLAVPLASQPTRISGRNWLNRRIAIEAIRNDPGWRDGDYITPPTQWLVTQPAGRLTSVSPLVMQDQAPDIAAGDALYRKMVDDARKLDANDALYATEAIMDYAPEKLLPRIRARLLAINSADDGVNPPELGVTERAIATIPGGRFVLIPIGPATRGHLTYEQAAVWKAELVRALAD